MKTAIFCTAQSQQQAAKIVLQLQGAGFAAKDFFLQTTSRDEVLSEAVQRHAMRGCLVGALLGSSLGLLAGCGVISIPGWGLSLVAGPLAATVSGGAIGGGGGLLLAAIASYSYFNRKIPKGQKKQKMAHILITIYVDGQGDIERVTKILKEAGAQQISSSMRKEQA